jgi:hypothetical protein
MPQHLQCVLLHAVRFGEQGCILKLLSSEGEHIDALFNVSSKAKSSKRAFLSPLSALNLVLSYSKSNKLPYASQLSFQVGRSLVQAGPAHLALALFMAEVLTRISQWQKGDAALYNLTTDYLEKMQTANFTNELPIFFLLDIIDWSGFLPEPPVSSLNNLVFGLQSAAFLPAPGTLLEPSFSTEVTTNWIKLIALKSLPDSIAQRRELLGAMVRFLEWHFDKIGSIQSHIVFAEMNQA